VCKTRQLLTRLDGVPSAVDDRRVLSGRRRFLIATAVSLFGPRRAAGQQGRRPRIGWLTSSVVHEQNVAAFREGMRQAGHDDVVLEVRAAGGVIDRLPALASELLALEPDVIVADGGPAVLAAKRATSTVPVVFGATAGDVIEQGIVTSLARPGGNVTGFTISSGPELQGKRLELLREAVPAISRVAVIWNPANVSARAAIPAVAAAAKALAVQLDMIEARDAQEIERAFGRASRGRVGAMLTLADAFFWSQRARIVALAARQRLPAMYPELGFVEDGGLLAYGPNVAENFRRAAGYVDRILKGARPGELPIEQPARLDFAVNLKTARALGLTIPSSVLLRADRLLD
jgi:putative ABC transport system substrate-binding protein